MLATPSTGNVHATSVTLTNELTVCAGLASESFVVNAIVSSPDNRIEDAKVKRCPNACGLPVLRSIISAWRQIVCTQDEDTCWGDCRDELGARSYRWCLKASLPPASRH